MNVLDEYIKIVSDVCDAPELFIKASGYSLISNLLGRYFTCTTMPHGRPNLWFLMSSIPGRFRRSSVSGYYEHGYVEALREYMKVKEQKLTLTREDEKLIHGTKIFEGTPEGIADAITMYSERGINEFNISSSARETLYNKR